MGLRKPPSMREKRRYVIFRVISESPVEFVQVRDAVWNSILNWLGEDDAAKASIRIIRNLWSRKEQTGFVQCGPKYTDSVKIALGLVHQVGDSRAIIQSLRVSGTIKSGKEKALGKR
jgi:ribonuclease P/MRP protein subunit POP5